MLSRSSSAYQPLEATAHEMLDVGGVSFDTAGGPGDHEMTSIAVISAHPTTNVTSHQIIGAGNGPRGPGGGGGTGVGGGGKRAVVNDDFVDVIRSQKSDRTPWTSFHSIMCVGIIGFFIFWVFILCKMYLPAEYFWDLIEAFGGGANEEETAHKPPLMPAYSRKNVTGGD